MLTGCEESLSTFRDGQRDFDRYVVQRFLEKELKLQFSTLTKNDAEIDSLMEDLENVAYSRVASRYGRFRESFIWLRPQRTRKPRIRYDLKARVSRLSRDDTALKSFLINATLLEMCECLRSNPDKFWKTVKGEVDAINAKNSH